MLCTNLSNVAVGSVFVKKSAKLSFEQICCTQMSPFHYKKKNLLWQFIKTPIERREEKTCIKAEICILFREKTKFFRFEQFYDSFSMWLNINNKIINIYFKLNKEKGKNDLLKT